MGTSNSKNKQAKETKASAGKKSSSSPPAAGSKIVSNQKADAKSEVKKEKEAKPLIEEKVGPTRTVPTTPAWEKEKAERVLNALFLDVYNQIYHTPGNNWPRYPPKGIMTEEGGEFPVEVEYHIALVPKEEEVKKGIKDDKGFEPRNIMRNLQLDPRDPKRQAMPLDFYSPHLSLYGSDEKPRPAVVEWINIKYRNEFDRFQTAEEVDQFIRAKHITYENIWFFDDEDYYELRFDVKGRPLNPVKDCDKLNITGSGFYFWCGPNFAVDITFTLKHQQEYYIFVIHGKGDADNVLRLVGGMRDIDKNNVAQRMFIELYEETGVLMDQEALERDRRAQRITSKITDEARATRNAYTQTIFSAVRFDSLEDIHRYVKQIDHQENHEADQRFLININYLYEHHLRDGAEGKMFAGHDKLILELIQRYQTDDIEFARYFQDENRRLQWRNKSRAEASLDLNHLLATSTIGKK